MKTIILIFILLIVIVIYASYYLFKMASYVKMKFFKLSDEQKKLQSIAKVDGNIWLRENAKEVGIKSIDKLKLTASKYYDKDNKNIFAICCHGYRGYKQDMVAMAKEFKKMKINSLLIDERTSGTSEGNYITMGYFEHHDVIGWINYLCKKHKDCKIILYGVSMGAATVMMASGENLPENVKLVIEDCGYTNAGEEFKHQIKNFFHFPIFPFYYVASLFSKIKAKYFFYESSPIDMIRKSKLPTLFIHGKKDTFVPFSMLSKLYRAHKGPKEKLIIKGANHAESYQKERNLYIKEVKKFIKKYVEEDN